ncbi:hypothetical protein N7280_01500 [Rickettsia rhipicephali]|uniref:hypothetical protein n=1 Tax=Rickettsia rhipicephali TaxID=33992 RepID=UPI0022531D58|nr:hypothetical protein [Rickettsia rhipicephali]MCX4079330.1 hypothetical protein [Rickettsia rhipicephali]
MIVGSNVFFSTPSGPINSELGAVKIDGNMNFQNNAGTAIFASDIANNITSAITGNITSTGGTNGTIGTVDGNGNSTNTITNLAMLKVGADNSTVTINAGSHKFDDDVWLQKAVTGTNAITFAPKKTAFIASDLGANTISCRSSNNDVYL